MEQAEHDALGQIDEKPAASFGSTEAMAGAAAKVAGDETSGPPPEGPAITELALNQPETLAAHAGDLNPNVLHGEVPLSAMSPTLVFYEASNAAIRGSVDTAPEAAVASLVEAEGLTEILSGAFGSTGVFEGGDEGDNLTSGTDPAGTRTPVQIQGDNLDDLVTSPMLMNPSTLTPEATPNALSTTDTFEEGKDASKQTPGDLHPGSEQEGGSSDDTVPDERVLEVSTPGTQEGRNRATPAEGLHEDSAPFHEGEEAPTPFASGFDIPAIPVGGPSDGIRKQDEAGPDDNGTAPPFKEEEDISTPSRTGGPFPGMPVGDSSNDAVPFEDGSDSSRDIAPSQGEDITPAAEAHVPFDVRVEDFSEGIIEVVDDAVVADAGSIPSEAHVPNASVACISVRGRLRHLLLPCSTVSPLSIHTVTSRPRCGPSPVRAGH